MTKKRVTMKRTYDRFKKGETYWIPKHIAAVLCGGDEPFAEYVGPSKPDVTEADTGNAGGESDG